MFLDWWVERPKLEKKKCLVRSKMYIHMELRKRAESCLQARRGTSKKAMARERRLMS